MATTETLNIVISTKSQGDGAQKAETSLKGLVSAAKAFVGVKIAVEVGKFVVEMTKLGAQSQAAANRFEQFAGGAREAAGMLDAFNEGTQGTVDRMTGMASAAKLMQMGLVETTDDMEMVTAIATRLGDQTQQAGDRISDFALMLANQSIPRLDNFGISSGRVRARIDELLKSGEALNREQAFKMAVMEEGAKALDTLGDTSELAGTKIDKMTAAWRDTKTALGEAIATVVDASGALDAGAESSRTYADQVYAFSNTLSGLKDGTLTWNDLLKATTISMRDGAAAGEQYLDQLLAMKVGAIGAADGQRYLSGEVERAEPAVSRFTWATNDSTEAHEQYQMALDMTERALDKTAQATMKAQAAEEEALKATQRHAEYLFDASMSFTDFYRRQEETAQDYAQRLEDAETEHQEKLAEIAKKGQSSRVAVDEEGLAIELRIDQGRLQQLLERQAKFNADTTDLERAQTERSIRNLQGEIAEKTGLLERAADGYVTIAGKNVDELVGEEKRRYEEELRLLEESRAEQEAEQKRSLGKMILANFNAYAQMAFGADQWTDEEIKYVQEMQAKIAEEYGLITETAATETARQAQYWADTVAIMRGEANGFFDAFQQRFNALPKEHVIRIRTEMAGPPADIPDKPPKDEEGTTPVPKPKPKPKKKIVKTGEIETLGAGLFTRTTPTSTATLNLGGGVAPVGVSIGPVYITNSDPEQIWKELERYARLKGKSGWQQLGR